ncbi:MAG TPA: ABC transporter ATP-binding protein, partial [Patescibacteria group bacterium]|nr:ABC transporter ATP-binding protein [Patescibacteria group bacterium]
LLNVIGCIAEPSSGWMMLDGDIVYDSRWVMKDLRRLRREKIGFIFQTHNLLPFLDATENVMIALHLNGVKTDDARKRAKALLDYLEAGHRGDAMPGELSGGEAQRVAIARALANTPRVILADEPTAALDSERAAIVMGLLRKVAREQQAAVLVVSHDDKIFALFDRVFRLRDGKLTEEQVMLAGR